MRAFLAPTDEPIPEMYVPLLIEHNLIFECDNEEDEQGPYTLYDVNPEQQDGWDKPLKVADLIRLRGVDRSYLSKRGPLNDTEALTIIHYILSAPEWSVSYLEDIRAVVARVPRFVEDVKGAQWAWH